jgi:hypothetical protein
MYGKITKFRDDLGIGVIEAGDGRKYRFAKSAIRNPSGALTGEFVDFELDSRRPRDIILMTGSAWTAFGGIDYTKPPKPAAPNRAASTATVIDFTDLPRVSAEELGLPMRTLIASGRGLTFLRGLSEEELRDIDEIIWNRLGSDDPIRRLAVVLRFRGLIDVFSAPRLRDLFLHQGYRLIGHAVKVAATLRFNAERGFNPFLFERALRQAIAPAHAMSNPAQAAVMRRHARAEIAALA